MLLAAGYYEQLLLRQITTFGCDQKIGGGGCYWVDINSDNAGIFKACICFIICSKIIMNILLHMHAHTYPLIFFARFYILYFFGRGGGDRPINHIAMCTRNRNQPCQLTLLCLVTQLVELFPISTQKYMNMQGIRFRESDT